MEFSNEGFYIPFVNNSLCTNCGLCIKVCPVKNIEEEPFVEPETYVSWSLCEATRINSSSGGIYPELARYIIKNGGVVYAVGWNKKDWLPEHQEITSVEEIEKTIGSKYVQSKVGSSIKNAIKKLESNRPVLFVGTPCQVAGFKRIINIYKINSNKLYLIDLICHGTPAPLIFNKYLNESFRNKSINNIYFRKKIKGWGTELYLLINFKNGFYKKHWSRDEYYWCFLNNLYLNKSCYSCRFAKIPRQGDITLGDFWGVPEKYYDDRGISVVLINTKKGKDIFLSLENDNKIFAEKVDFNLAIAKNPRIISGVMEIPQEREKIFALLNKKSWSYIAKKYIVPPRSLKGYLKRSIKYAKKVLAKITKG
jgi:coenzyme F420-reducing hydrogenase beta subunit